MVREFISRCRLTWVEEALLLVTSHTNLRSGHVKFATKDRWLCQHLRRKQFVLQYILVDSFSTKWNRSDELKEFSFTYMVCNVCVSSFFDKAVGALVFVFHRFLPVGLLRISPSGGSRRIIGRTELLFINCHALPLSERELPPRERLSVRSSAKWFLGL